MDRIPFKTLIKSESISYLFEKASLRLSRSVGTIGDIINNDADKLKNDWKQEIEILIKI